MQHRIHDLRVSCGQRKLFFFFTNSTPSLSPSPSPSPSLPLTNSFFIEIPLSLYPSLFIPIPLCLSESFYPSSCISLSELISFSSSPSSASTHKQIDSKLISLHLKKQNAVENLIIVIVGI